MIVRSAVDEPQQSRQVQAVQDGKVLHDIAEMRREVLHVLTLGQVYIYIYIYVSTCVYVCVYIYIYMWMTMMMMMT